ncbi:hypothetical protein LINPERHAP2_LOCUS15753, partial [Linum perenne]
MGNGDSFKLSQLEWTQAFHYVLVNSPAAQPLLRECEVETRRELGRRASETAINKAVHRKLVSWVQKKILDGSTSHNEDWMTLARGPNVHARRFTIYDINGYRFRTIAREEGLKTQNSGVATKFGTDSVSSSSGS